MDRFPSTTILTALAVPPIGHGLVGTYPDQPYLQWAYVDSKGERIPRDNSSDFTRAANRLCQEFRRYRVGNPEADVPGLEGARDKITDMLVKVHHTDGDVRHKAWTDALADDHFGFGAVDLHYQGKGKGSWKHQALGDTYLKWQQAALDAMKANSNANTTLLARVGAEIHSLAHRAEAIGEMLGVEPAIYPFAAEFPTSNYKLFHDAARDQRYAVFGEILPRPRWPVKFPHFWPPQIPPPHDRMTVL